MASDDIAARSGRPEGDVRLPWAGTFHAMANRILRDYAPNLGLDPSFSVLDRGDAADLMDVCRQERNVARLDRRFPRKDTCLAIYSHRVNTCGTLGDRTGRGTAERIEVVRAPRSDPGGHRSEPAGDAARRPIARSGAGRRWPG